MSLGRKIVFVIALMVFVGAVGAIANHYLQGMREESAFEELKEAPKAKGIWTDKGYVIAKYAGLYKKNKDIIGWVKVKDTKIDYPVMHTPDDGVKGEFYLRKDFKKEYSLSGTPFLDQYSDIFKPTKNWLLYGHNMNNGSMFHDLLQYAEKDFYENHKKIRFDTIYKGGQAQYEVVAAFYSQIYPKDQDIFKYYTYAGITTDEELNEYVTEVKKLSQYDTGVEVKSGDQLITLSTCSYHVDDKLGRFAVVAKRINK